MVAPCQNTLHGMCVQVAALTNLYVTAGGLDGGRWFDDLDCGLGGSQLVGL